jgi:hypothetical protein
VPVWLVSVTVNALSVTPAAAVEGWSHGGAEEGQSRANRHRAKHEDRCRDGPQPVRMTT